MTLSAAFSSIRSRLICGGLLMFCLTAAAALFALTRFADSYSSLNELTRQSLVTANHARQLDEAVNAFSARSAAALETEDPDAYEPAYKATVIAWYEVRRRAGIIPESLFETVGYPRTGGLARLDWLAAALDEARLDLMAMDRLEARLFADLSFDLKQLRARSDRVKQDAGRDLSRNLADFAVKQSVGAEDTRRLMTEDFSRFQNSLEANVSAVLILSALDTVRLLTLPEQINAKRVAFTRHLATLEHLFQRRGPEQEEADALFDDLRRKGIGDDNVFDKRLDHLALDQEFATLKAEFLIELDRFALASHHLSDSLVQTASDHIERIENNVIQSIVVTVALLLTALLSSVILGWLILQRGIAAPLRQVETAMRSIAVGQVKTPMPHSNVAELGNMIAALETLRRYVERVTTAEENLRASQREFAEQTELLRGILASLSQGVVAYDHNLKLLTWNDQFLNVLGYPREMVFAGQDFETLIGYDALHGGGGPGDPDQMAKEQLDSARRFAVHSFDRQSADGQFIEVRGGPLQNGGYVATYTDVSERKAAERQTQALLEAAPDAMLAIDDKGVIVLANAYTETVFGYQRQELVGAKLEILFPEKIYHHELVETGLTSPDSLSMREGAALHKSGRSIPVEIMLNRVDTGGRRLVIIAARDISLRKRAEEEIIKRTEQLQSAIDGMPAGFLMFDADGVLRIWNQRYRELVRLPDSVFKGVPSLNSIVKAQFERGDFAPLALASVIDAQTALKQAYCGDAAQSTEHYWPGLDRHVIVSSNPLPSGGWVLIYNDISPIKKAEAALIQARDQARAATRAKDLFLATMSHEIRTPMNGVIGMIDLLTQTSLAPDQRQMTGTIRDSAAALLTILNDVLDFSKIEAGKMRLETVPIALHQIVDGVGEMMRADAMKKAIRFVCYCDPDIPPTVLGDQVRLRQILFNLLGNALKFTDEGKNVVLRADLIGFSDTGDQAIVRYRITDQGIGMTQAQISELFKPFQQAEASTTRRFGGTGLGLSIVRRLVKLMGGEVAVDSTPDVGSTFTVTLHHEVVKGTVSPSAPSSEADLSDLRVLALVVPDPVCETLVRRYLSAAGAEVTLTGRPDDVFDAAGAARDNHLGYQVVYLDAGWPDILKTALIERFRADKNLCDTRFVLAQARGGTAEPMADTTIVSATPLIRRHLIDAVAVAAGRAGSDIRPDTGFGTAEAEPIRPKTAPSVEAAIRNKELILVIEDNRTNQDVIRRQINLLGYQCEIAEDGLDGLRAIRSGRYAMALSDVNMPEMDGLEMTAKLREHKKTARFPIIAITANALQGEEQRCLGAGMDGYLSKPLDIKQLQTVLAQWLPHAGTGAPASLPDDTAVIPVCDADIGEAVDVSALTDVFGDDQKVIVEILREFLPVAEETVIAMEQALNRQEGDAIAAQAHKLKSSSKAIGAHGLSACCFQAETAAKDGDWAHLTDLVPNIRAQYDLAEAFIERYCG